MARGNLVRYFANQGYSNAGEAIEHAAAISDQIRANKPVKKPRVIKPLLSSLDSAVLELAPRFAEHRYPNGAIAREIFKQRKKTPTLEEVRILAKIIYKHKRKLERRKLLSRTSYTPKKNQEVSEEEIERHVPLIRWTLFKYGRIIPHNWRKFLTVEDAIEVGKTGLQRALEVHEPNRGALTTHATLWIASAIAREVKKRRRMVSLDEIDRATGRTLHEVIGNTSFDPEVLENDIELLLKSRLARPHHIAVYTLRNVFGHNFREIGRQTGVSGSMIGQTYKAAQWALKRRKAAMVA